MSNYWTKRIANAQDKLGNKSIAEIEKQLKAYNKNAIKSTLKDMENLYYRLLAKQTNDTPILASDIYRLDKYWETLNDMKDRLKKLGDKEIAYIETQFTETYKNIFEAIPGLPSYNTSEMFTLLSDAKVKECINSIWCGDKSWSKRIWGNLENLQSTLNDSLVDCIVTGKKTTYLKQVLQERFGVSYGQANRLVRTEVTHIQTQAAADRYKAANVQEYEVLAGQDEMTCPECGAMNGRRYRIDEMVVGNTAPPFH